MRREFGVKQLGFFISMIILEDNCFFYKNKRYAWKDILVIKRADDLFSEFLRFPSTIVLLSDGTIFRVPVVLQEKDVKNKVNFLPYGYEKSSYKEFVDIIHNKPTGNKKSLIKYLCSYNYIMIYRMLIAVSLVFATFILFVLCVLNVKLKLIIVWLIIVQMISMTTGIFMLVKRRLNESIMLKELKNYKKSTKVKD